MESNRDHLLRIEDRRGKWVVLRLDPGRGWIVIQPRMTGGFRLGEESPPDHARLAFAIDRSRQVVWYCDKRRLGKVVALEHCRK